MPDRTGFKKVDYAQWYGAYSTVERLANARHIAHQQDVRERANQRDGGDINQCRCEPIALQQILVHKKHLIRKGLISGRNLKREIRR